jgi:hypothetical protein
MRQYLADTFAMIIFSTIVGMFVEIVVAELTLQQSTSIRLAAIPIMLLAARPYGIYRDWLFRIIVGKKEGQLVAAAIDTLANLTFQIPLYVCLLIFNGASMGQVFTAVGSIIFIITISGRPYGLFLVLIRKLFGVPTRARSVK